MCLFISLGPSKYPEKWRFTWDNSSTLTIVGLGLYIHTHLTSAKGLSPSCGRILKPFPAGVFYMVHPGDSQGQRRLSQIKIKDWLFDLWLVGGLEHDFFDFPIQLIQLIVGKNHPNWRTQIFQRGRYTTNQYWYLQLRVGFEHQLVVAGYNLVNGESQEPTKWPSTEPILGERRFGAVFLCISHLNHG